jgi:N-dimethylarginine dimethylaminohydrolase
MKALESRVHTMLVMPGAVEQPDCVFVEDVAVCIGPQVGADR